MKPGDAPIAVRLSSEGVGVQHARVDLGPVIAELPVDKALALIPKLLPVCGAAQAIAAERAFEAARGVAESETTRHRRARALWREQAIATAWRLLVDWPRALSLPADLARLKALRQSDDASLREALLDLLPPPPIPGQSPQQILESWHREAGPAGPPLWLSMLERAAGVPRSGPSLATLGASTLRERAHAFLNSPRLMPDTLALDEEIDAITVGPLAMARDPAIAALADTAAIPTAVKLIAAALLDGHAIARGLTAGEAPGGSADGTPDVQSGAGPRAGFGVAATLRGPLIHIAVLDGADRVAHWRHLAPTDWHFAPGGLVDRLGRGLSDPRDLRVLVAAADPCAPWKVTDDRGPAREAA